MSGDSDGAVDKPVSAPDKYDQTQENRAERDRHRAIVASVGTPRGPVFGVIGLVFALGAPGLVLVAGWTVYTASRIRRGAFEPTQTVPSFDLEVSEVREDQITLRPLAGQIPRRWRQSGLWGLGWSGGRGQVGEILEASDTQVTRRWRRWHGELGAGQPVRLDSAALPPDPRVGLGLDFREATWVSPVGPLRGAVATGDGSAWAVFIHGKRPARPAPLPHAYPILSVVREFGLPCLDVPYRNDPGAPPTEDGLHWYGLKEWEDLDAAVRWALGQGAERLLLVGYSMGGAIALSFLDRSPLAGRVAGVILDAPVLDLRRVIEFGIRQRGIPPALIRPGLWLLGRQLGAEWSEFDHLRNAGELRCPILLFHGEDDPTVPIDASDDLARLRPDLVTYVRTPDAAHAQAWNVDPVGYEAAVRAFIGGLV